MSMVLILVGISMLLTLANGAEFLCVQGSLSSAQPTACLNGAKSCCGPKFREHLGFTNKVKYGCGKCEPGLSFECVDCSESGCNKPSEPVESFSCYNYRVARGAVTRHPTLSTCWRSKSTNITCNMPTGAGEYRSVSGCGPCGQTSKKMGSCAECYSDSCNYSKTSIDRNRNLGRAKRSVSAECAEKCPYS